MNNSVENSDKITMRDRMYGKINVSVKSVDVFIWVLLVLLAVTVVLAMIGR